MKHLDTKSLVAGALVALALISVSQSRFVKAQTLPPLMGAVLSACGAASYSANTFAPITLSATGTLCVNQ